MNRDVLERMTKEELMELVSRQNEAIDSLDQQRYDSSDVIEHLVRATHDMQNLRYHDMERSHCQDRLDDFVREMYGKYPMYLVSAEYPQDIAPAEADKDEATDAAEERENLLHWMSKFCRHIDMGDKPYTDDEAYEFWKNKMYQQFGWEVDE